MAIEYNDLDSPRFHNCLIVQKQIRISRTSARKDGKSLEIETGHISNKTWTTTSAWYQNKKRLLHNMSSKWTLLAKTI